MSDLKIDTPSGLVGVVENTPLHPISEQIPKRRYFYWILLTILIAAGAYRDARLLFRHNVAVGQNGPYYELQSKSLIEHGKLFYPTRSLGFIYATAGVARLTGNSLLTIKAFSITLICLLSLGIYLLVRGLTGSDWLGLLAVGICQFSPQHFYYLAEFNSSLLSVTLLVWSGMFLLCGFNSNVRRARMYLIVGTFLLIVACVADVSAIFLAVAFAACAAIANSFAASRKIAYLNSALLAALILWIAPFALSHFPQRWLWPQLSSVALRHPTWPVSGFGWPEKLLLLCASAILLILTSADDEETSPRQYPVATACAVLALVVTLNPFVNFQAGAFNIQSEVLNTSYLLVALVSVGLLAKIMIRGHWIMYGAFYLAILLFTMLSARTAEPQSLSDPYLADRLQLMHSLHDREADISKSAWVVASPQDSYVVTDALGVPSLAQFPLAVPPGRVFWLVRHVPSSLALPSMIVLVVDGDYATVLVPDRALKAELSSAQPDSLATLEAFNPHLNQINLVGAALRLGNQPR